MKRAKADPDARIGGIALAEEAVHALRTAPFAAWAAYAIGSGPFVIALMYFWADMAYSPFARQRLVAGSLVLTALFVWMKAWQSVFSGRMHAHVMDAAAPKTHVVDFLRIAATQSIIQTTGLVLLPLSLIVAMPFPWVYAAYQNATVLGAERGPGLRDTVQRSIALAGIAPNQNLVLIWLLSPALPVLAALFFFILMPVMQLTAPIWSQDIFAVYGVILGIVLIPLSPVGLVLGLNLAATIVFVPQLLRMFFGIETAFTINFLGVMNPTFFVVICAAIYLLLDPAIKTAYVLRRHHADSRRNALDLRLELRRIPKAALILAFAAIGFMAQAQAQDTPPADAGPDAAALDRALDEVLEGRDFAWRMPREASDAEAPGFMKSVFDFLRWLNGVFKDIFEWIMDVLFGRDEASSASGGLGSAGEAIRYSLALLFVLLALATALLMYRAWRRNRRVVATAVPMAVARPDIEDESTTAEALPEDGWLALARELYERGEYRLAMRAYFLAGLSRLAHTGLVRIARHKSNREYARELDRFGHTAPRLPEDFRLGIRLFESVWYGQHPVSPEGYAEFAAVQDALRNALDAPAPPGGA